MGGRDLDWPMAFTSSPEHVLPVLSVSAEPSCALCHRNDADLTRYWLVVLLVTTAAFWGCRTPALQQGGVVCVALFYRSIVK